MTTEEHQGLIQIYTGNGKGKSTAAFGLALRASGAGMKTVILQFMKKGEWYSEIKAFDALPQVQIHSFGSEHYLKKGELPSDADMALAAQAMAKAKEVMADRDIDILILDELCIAVYFGLVKEEEALRLMENKPTWQELVITGRNATEAMIAGADLVTEMREIKHPYQKGITARKGIEF